MAEDDNIRITQGMIYAKQLEMHEVQVRMLQKLDHLDDIPERVREVELSLARLEWIERVAYSALVAGVAAIIGLLINIINK